MDTSDAPDAPDMAGVIDATDPPTAADHSAPPPAGAADDGTGDDSTGADPPAASASASSMAMDATPTSDLPPGRPITPQEEEEARQAIDLLRGDDVAGRVEAANKLESVAAALGVERTRDVS